jgi:SAM-dependent methyltransferase
VSPELATGLSAKQRLLRTLYSNRAAYYRYIAPTLQRTHLAGVVFRGYERLLAFGEAEEDWQDDGLAIPPARLRVLVYGTASTTGFLDSGRVTAKVIADVFAEAGLELPNSGALLDFGCGCGRVLRHWTHLQDVDIYGCDYNAQLAEWTARNLPHVSATTNALAPPAPYQDASFGAIYAISVFTHLSQDLQLAWMNDLMRLLRPGGYLLFTTHGETMASSLLDTERALFDRGELVVRFDGEAGSNLCNAFHPESWVRKTWAEQFEVKVFRPGGAPGVGDQDIWAVRARK